VENPCIDLNLSAILPLLISSRQADRCEQCSVFIVRSRNVNNNEADIADSLTEGWPHIKHMRFVCHYLSVCLSLCFTVCLCADDWEIPFENISDLQWLGSGAQGAVFLGKLKGELVAIKKLRDKRETDIRHLRKLNHPNIISFKYVTMHSMCQSLHRKQMSGFLTKLE